MKFLSASFFSFLSASFILQDDLTESSKDGSLFMDELITIDSLSSSMDLYFTHVKVLVFQRTRL